MKKDTLTCNARAGAFGGKVMRYVKNYNSLDKASGTLKEHGTDLMKWAEELSNNMPN